MADKSPPQPPGDLETARALNAAREQISEALREAQAPVELLGEALGALAELLSSGGLRAAQPEQLKALREQLQQAVTGLQFYDRLTQHLGHVQDYLAGSARKLGADPQVQDSRWTGLHRQLSDRLLSVPARGASAPGDIDLF